MKSIDTVMLYIKAKMQWYMFDCKTGGHLQEYHDCENIRKHFEEIHEQGRNYYRIYIEKITEEESQKRKGDVDEKVYLPY